MYSTRISRHIGAPPAAVYQALVDPYAVERWRVPDGMSGQVHEFDAREGGAFRVSLTYDLPGTGGKTSAHTDTYHGRFVRLVPGEQVVEVVEFETADPGLRGEMTMTTTLTESGGGTEVVILHEGIPDAVPAADNEAGTRMALANLARLVEPVPDAPRVFLRHVGADDQDEFVRLVRVSADLHHPWMHLPATPEAFAAHLARYADREAEQSLLVCVRETGAIAGLVNINSVIRGRFQCASVAYAAFAPSAGRGYMTEGLRLVLRHVFEVLRLHRLEANIQPGNESSLKMVRRLGFLREGYSPALLFIDGAWRDHERWAITAAAAGLDPGDPHPTLPSR
ncbi:GNAT family N-acetyltransferase [Microbispora sp. RL4-1S]|uniref:GNAT family N-acetyltransferase n=1 Tax=Microbispora oryzae TaxID=2806554 RepID=A0A940WIR2_9ACTN|nr:GNAT family N-acetyltransferase [Microbispora oryzae]MBP2706261.1 GNAT family N-acetyltransferase [Microbispora oryzae]